MSTTIVVSCPECKKQLKAPEELRGKRIRCKGCGATFAVPGAAGDKPNPAAGAPAPKKPAAAGKAAPGKPAPAKASPAAKATPKPAAPPIPDDEDGTTPYGVVDFQTGTYVPPAPKTEPAPPPPKGRKKTAEEEDGANPYGVTDLDLAPRCPHCAAEMESEDSYICLVCGYNTRTREKGETVKTIAHTPGERILWLSPGILSALGTLLCIGIIVWLWIPAGLMSNAEDKEGWLGFFAALATQIWGSVFAAAGGWFALKFAIKRLIKHPSPPEKIKR